MKHIKSICVAVLFAGLSACAHQSINNEEALEKTSKEEVIGLENLRTRDVVYCHDSVQMSIDECVKYMENYGFVKLTDIPKFMADRNTLTTGTYPTRRWRETDRIPRW